MVNPWGWLRWKGTETTSCEYTVASIKLEVEFEVPPHLDPTPMAIHTDAPTAAVQARPMTHARCRELGPLPQARSGAPHPSLPSRADVN